MQNARNSSEDIALRAEVNVLMRHMNTNSDFYGYYFFGNNEKLVNIWNTYFCRRGAFRSDEDVLKILMAIFQNLSNDLNARRVQQLLDAMSSGFAGDDQFDFGISSEYIQEMRPLFPEESRYKMRELYSAEEHDYSKYLRELDSHIVRVLVDYREVSSTKTSHVLDIGTGLGLLPYVYQTNGHIVDTIDMPGVHSDFCEARKILGLENHTEFRIEKYKKLIKLGKKFDIITCGQICFNDFGTAEPWHAEEWKFFLKDLYENHLTDDGFVWLGFNHGNREVDGVVLELTHKDVHNLFDPFIDQKKKFKAARLQMNDIASVLNFS